MMVSFITLSFATNTHPVAADNSNEPVAVLTISKTTIYSGETVQSDASSSYLTNGNITEYQFLFDDGNDTGWISTPNITHHYTKPGTYRIQLRVKGDNGKISSWNTKQVVVLNQLPSISITSPKNQSTVSGIISIEGVAGDNDGVIQSVNIEINGVWNQAKITGTHLESWTYQWNTTQISDGTYRIVARSFDGLDYSVDVVLYLTVDNAGLKTSIMISNSPTFITTYPADTIKIYGDATYNTGNKTTMAAVTIRIQEYGDLWNGNTNSNGYFEISVTAPNITGSYNITIKISDGYILGQTIIPLSVMEKPLSDFGISENDIIFENEWNKTGIVTIYASIHNYNVVNATTNVAFYDGDPDHGGSIIGTTSVYVPQKSAATVSAVWKGKAGIHDMWVVVDLGNWIIESNELNNRAWRQITLIEKSDLEIENILFSNNAPNTGDNITITVKIANILGVYTNTTLKIYDGNPSKNGTLIYSNKINIPPLGTPVITNWQVSGNTQVVYAVLTNTTPKDVNGDNDVFSKELRPIPKDIERSNIPTISVGYLLMIFVGVALISFFGKYRK
jgi:hypothetical protein